MTGAIRPVCVCPVLQELESSAVRGEFLLCVLGKREGVEQRKILLSHLALTSLEGMPNYVVARRKGGATHAAFP